MNLIRTVCCAASTILRLAMGRHLEPAHVNILMPFGTPFDLETGSLKEQIAGSHAGIIETSA